MSRKDLELRTFIYSVFAPLSHQLSQTIQVEINVPYEVSNHCSCPCDGHSLALFSRNAKENDQRSRPSCIQITPSWTS